MNTSEIPDDLITPLQAAQLLGVHLATIYRYILDGRLPAWRLAGTRFKLSRVQVLGLLQPAGNSPPDRTPSHAEATERLKKLGWM